MYGVFTYVKLSYYSQITGRFSSATRENHISCLRSVWLLRLRSVETDSWFPAESETHMAAGYIPLKFNGWNMQPIYCWWQPEIRRENQLRLVVYPT